jgi:hypothetical protein
MSFVQRERVRFFSSRTLFLTKSYTIEINTEHHRYAQLRIRINGPLSHTKFTCVFYDEVHKLRNDETSLHKACRRVRIVSVH